MTDTMELVPVETQSGTLTELSSAPSEYDLTSFNRLFQQAQRLATSRPVVSISPKYWEFNTVGEVRRGVFLGMKTIYKNEESIDCIQWLEPDGEVYINGGKALVSMFENIPMGTSFEVTYEGKKVTSKGYKANIFGVKILYSAEEPVMPF